MKENTLELIIERAKFLHVDMVAMQIAIRQQLMRRAFREGRDGDGDLHFYILDNITHTYFERTGIALPIN
jgi:hypothetical protein